ncbi:MAG: chorismate mutase [Cellulosilyticaceae bacterium]
MEIVAIRGAITVSDNTKEDIINSTKELIEAILTVNDIHIEDIVEILFTATKDLTAVYPAVGARELGIIHAALMCMQEMYVEGSLTMCIRVSMHVKTTKFSQTTVQHQYLREAARLRPDLTKTTEGQ